MERNLCSSLSIHLLLNIVTEISLNFGEKKVYPPFTVPTLPHRSSASSLTPDLTPTTSHLRKGIPVEKRKLLFDSLKQKKRMRDVEQVSMDR